ncbi:MAG: response regulator [Deltaproteobacteria bacterium]|nr:response regulator [Deltaproteobacteria bacterium]
MRYALLDDDLVRRELLDRTLQRSGFRVVIADKLAEVNKARTLSDSLIAVGEPSRLSLLLESTSALSIPVVLVTPSKNLGDLVPLIGGHVYGLLTVAQGTEALVRLLRRIEQELVAHGLRTSGAEAARRGLALLRAARASGILRIESPRLVGQVWLQRGDILDAELGSMRGGDAAAALIAGMADSVALSWTSIDDSEEGGGRAGGVLGGPLLDSVDGSALPSLAPEALRARGSVRVLVADDDEAIRKLLQRGCEHHGLNATVVVDGKAGIETALRERPDVIVSDVMMPKLDGWGFLAAVRSDYRLRETPFALLSCHGEYLEHLRQLDAGADAYLPKGTRIEEVVDRIWSLARPRLELLARLGPSISLRGRLARLGPVSLLRILAARNATGTLALEDSWASYQLRLSAGVVASASAQFGSSELADEEALRSFIGSQRGAWRLESGIEPDRWTLSRSALELVEEIAVRATEDEQRIRESLMTGTLGLVAHPQRIAFYEQVCPPSLQSVVTMVRSGMAPRQILQVEGNNPLVVDWLIKDMLTKGVVRFSELA